MPKIKDIEQREAYIAWIRKIYNFDEGEESELQPALGIWWSIK